MAWVMELSKMSGPLTKRMEAEGAIAPDHSTSSEASPRSSRLGGGQLVAPPGEQLWAAPGSPPSCTVVGRLVVLSPAALRKAVTSAVVMSTAPMTAMSPQVVPEGTLWQLAP